MNSVIIGVLLISLLIISFSYWQKWRDQKLLKEVTRPHRGTASERSMVLRLLKDKIPSQTIFHDLYVKSSTGGYSQIDMVVATKVGIVVFEIKEYSGWIFGTGGHREWTQVLAYGREKYRFYNPIFQNRKHIEVLASQLTQFRKIPFYSVIVFDGDCELKDLRAIPDDVFLIKPWEVSNLFETILLGNPEAPYTNKWEIVNVLKAAVQNGDDMQICEDHRRHVQSIVRKYRYE